MLAARTLASGLMAGLTSPARPWFVLGLGSPALSAVPEVRAWLDDVQGRMFRVFARSNLYNALAVAYEELAVFGTAALVVTEDAKEIVRAYPLTAGEYWLGASERQSVNTLYRTLGMTSFQLVERFGRGAVSVGVRERYDRGEWDHVVEVVHAIEPNEEVRALGEAAARPLATATCRSARSGTRRAAPTTTCSTSAASRNSPPSVRAGISPATTSMAARPAWMRCPTPRACSACSSASPRRSTRW